LVGYVCLKLAKTSSKSDKIKELKDFQQKNRQIKKEVFSYDKFITTSGSYFSP